MNFTDSSECVCCECVCVGGGACVTERARARNQPNQHEAPRDTAILPTCREKIKTRNGVSAEIWIRTAPSD